MPVTATLGALSYARTTASIGLNYNHYCLQLATPYTVKSIAFDPVHSNNYYLSGIFDSSTYIISNFTEAPNYPSQKYTVKHNVTGMTSTNNGTLKYNNYTANLIMAASYVNSSNSATRGSLMTFDPSTGLKVNSVSNVLDSTLFDFNNFAIGPAGVAYLTGSIKTNSPVTNNKYVALRKWSSTSNSPSLLYSTNRKSSSIDIVGKDVALDSNNNPFFLCNYILSSTNIQTAIIKTNSSLNPTVVQYAETLLGDNLIPIQLKVDNSDNIFFISNDNDSTPNSYVVKWNNTLTTLLWSKRIIGVTLNSIYVDTNDNNNVYVAGISDSTNNLYIAKLDYLGNKIFEREIHNTSGASFTNVGNIVVVGSNMYIVGNISNGFVLKLPNDGSIPGTGTYNFIGNLASPINYASVTKTYVNFAITPLLSDASTTTSAGGISVSDINDTSVSQNTYIANI